MRQPDRESYEPFEGDLEVQDGIRLALSGLAVALAMLFGLALVGAAFGLLFRAIGVLPQRDLSAVFGLAWLGVTVWLALLAYRGIIRREMPAWIGQIMAGRYSRERTLRGKEAAGLGLVMLVFALISLALVMSLIVAAFR